MFMREVMVNDGDEEEVKFRANFQQPTWRFTSRGNFITRKPIKLFCIIGGTEHLSLKLVVGHCRHWNHVRAIFFWEASMNKSRVDPVRNEYF